ncbi:hypothetical protein [Novosphingobium sp. CCH12-A3]|uniref:hypothetical protein n=1 Tax=Novosphingobium sp. CCH12-A3 TaxID=1768752 RepID=UPI00078043D2|nr:hypothetical protein [Novosphingobium sp. CCH12-A3]
MKRLPILLAAALVVSACSGAKSTVIPTDPQKWDEIAEDVKSLSDDDRKLVVGYMMRMSVGAAFAGQKGGIPPGTTIGDAIKDQKDWLAKQKAEEEQAEQLKAKVAAQKAADAEQIRRVATIAVTNVDVVSQDIMAGRYSDRLNVEVTIENKSAKQISGVRGTVAFKDQFDQEIDQTTFSLDEDVKPGETRIIKNYGRDLNQFKDEDKKLASIPFAKMKVSFVPEMIVFADGSKIGSAETNEP